MRGEAAAPSLGRVRRLGTASRASRWSCARPVAAKEETAIDEDALATRRADRRAATRIAELINSMNGDIAASRRGRDGPALVEACAEIKFYGVFAESSRRPPRHRRDACSMASWRHCRFLTARPGAGKST